MREALIQPAVSRGVALRPTGRDADKASKRGDIDKGFDPLHAGQTPSRAFVPKWPEAETLFRGFLLALQQPDQIGHAGGVLALAFRWGRRVVRVVLAAPALDQS